MREGLGYFLFESRRPFKHVTCVPRARPQHGQHASPAGRSHRRPRRRQGGKGWQGRRQGRWKGGGRGAPDPLCAAALNARYTRLEPAERRRQRCGRRRTHTASSTVETAPRAATRCATTAAARLVAMDAPDPLCAAALNARYSVRAGGATAAETRSCGRRRPHTASSAVETASRAAARCATTAAARLVAMDAPDPLCAAALNARYSVRAGGATAAELRPPATFPSTTPPTRRQARADCHREEGEGWRRIRSPRARRGRARARAGAREPRQRRRHNASGGSAGGARRAPRRSPARS